MPEEALELLQRRLARYESGETGAVTEPGALAEAMAAMAGAFVFHDASGDLEFDLEILDAVAFLRLYRHQAATSQDAGSGEEDGLGELYEALRVFALLLRCDPDRVPDALTSMAQAVADDQGTDPLRLTVELGRLALDYQAFYAASRMLDTAVASGAVPGDRAALLSMLGRALRGLNTQVPNRVTADQMADAFRGAVAALDAGDDRHAGMLSNLSVALVERFDTYRDPGDAQEAVAAAQEAVDRTPAADPDRAARLANLGNALAARYERGGYPHDRQQAISAHRQAVRQAVDTDPERAGMLANLARALLLTPVPGIDDAVRSRMDDIAEAVTAARVAAEATDPASPAMPGRLAVLGTALAARFELSGDGPDLHDAVDTLRTAHHFAGGDPAVTITLAAALTTLYNLTGQPGTAHEAIGVLHGHADIAPGPLKAAVLTNLSAVYLARFEQAGAPGDLDAGLQAARLADQYRSPDDPARAAALVNLGSALVRRFAVSQALGDLDEAIGVLRATLPLGTAGPADSAGAHGNLAVALYERFSAAGQAADLDSAVEALGQALSMTQAGSAENLMYRGNLGVALMLRFEHQNTTADIDAAIGEFRAVAAASAGAEAATPYANLGLALRMKAIAAGSADFAAAIEAGRKPLVLVPESSPDRAMYLANLGDTLWHAYQADKGEDRDEAARPGMEEALDTLLAATRVPGAPLVHRLIAAEAAARRAADEGMWRRAHEAFSVSLPLLPQLAAHPVAHRPDVARLLMRWQDLASDAAACALLNDQPQQAVDFLEQGRGLLWASVRQVRADAELARAHPGLAAELAEARAALAAAGQPAIFPALRPARAGQPVPGGQETPGNRVPALEQQLEDVLRQIRAEKGFSRFLETLTSDDLIAMADNRPLVLLNVSRYGSHALALTSAGITQVPLPEADPVTVAEQAVTFLRALLSYDARPANQQTVGAWVTLQDTLSRVLDWLWRAVAEPVLTTLDLAQVLDGEQWPSVWWCPVGPLALLPLHAAASYDPRRPAGAAVLDRVVSSYTPTLTGLLRAREQLAPDNGRLLAVAVPEAPGLKALPRSEEGARRLAARFPGAVRVLAGDDATVEAVCSQLPGYSWTHWACHGRQDMTEPDRAALHLHDGLLTVGQVAELPLASPTLAFLCACHTASADTRLPDEGNHLVAACQVAGYRHVIGTLWEVNDEIADQVTHQVYDILLAGQHPDASGAALALHRAQRALRHQYPDAPSIWAGYVHHGP